MMAPDRNSSPNSFEPDERTQQDSEFLQFQTTQSRVMSSIEQFSALSQRQDTGACDLLVEGFEFLESRSQILHDSNPVVLREAVETAQYYNRHIQWQLANNSAADDSAGSSLEPVETVSRYMELVAVVPGEVQKLWEIGRVEGEDDGVFERVFEWNFDRLKRLDSDSSVPRVDIASRYGTLNELRIPYPVHTHVDVPYAMQQAGLLNSALSLYVAFAHDSIEEGRNLVYSPDESALLTEVTAEAFQEDFPMSGLGDRLAIAVNALTESSFEEMKRSISQEELQALETLTEPERQRALEQFPDRSSRVFKIAVEDPLVFGGLAAQIPVVVKELVDIGSGDSSLSRFDAEQRLELAISIISTEIGDRLSDMSTLEGDIEWFVDEALGKGLGDEPVEEALNFATYKITAYAARLINMHEKLTEAVEYLPEDKRSQFDHGLQLYLGTLLAKMSEIDVALKDYGHPGMSVEGLESYYSNEFRPAQQKAEEIFEGFVQNKVRTILESGQARSHEN